MSERVSMIGSPRTSRSLTLPSRSAMRPSVPSLQAMIATIQFIIAFSKGRFHDKGRVHLTEAPGFGLKVNWTAVKALKP